MGAVNEDLRWVSIALVSLGLHLARKVTEQWTHAESTNFLCAV